MTIQWDRSLSDWTSNLRPNHFKRVGPYYERNMKDSPWTKTEVEGVSYYGKSLDEKYWKQIKTGLKIVGTGLTFLPVVTIPLLICLGAHEKIVLWVLQLHTNVELKYRITPQPVVAPPASNPPLPALPKDVVGLIFKSPTDLTSDGAKSYFDTLTSLAKSSVLDKEDLRIHMINKGEIKIHEIPDLKGKKKKILNYIQTHGQKLTWLDLKQGVNGWVWSDQEIESIIKLCPNLKTFIHDDSIRSVTVAGEILKLTQLEMLSVQTWPQGVSLDSLKNLKGLHLMSYSFVPSLDHLTQLETLILRGTQNIPSLDKLVNLRYLDIYTETVAVPKLDNLIALEKLSISQGGQPLPSFDALTNLDYLLIYSSTGDIPSLEKQEKLTRLMIANNDIDELKLASQAPLQELILMCPSLTKYPKLDKPEALHYLYLRGGGVLPKDYLKQFTNLRRLDSPKFSADLMNDLLFLEDLSVSDSSQLNKMSPQQKRQLKKLAVTHATSTLCSLDDFVNLEELFISDLTVSISLEKNIELKKITIYNNGPTHSQFKRIDHLDKLKKLTHIYLNQCRELKLQKATLEALENLTHLQTTSCNKIREKRKKLISERLLRLKVASF